MSPRESADLHDRVTAKELREWGIPVPLSIPDEATVPKASIRFGNGTVTSAEEKTVLSMRVYIEAPFEWISVSFTIDAEGTVSTENKNNDG